MKPDWQPIETAPKEISEDDMVDVFLNVYTSPRSFGMADEYRVPDCWRHDGQWLHHYRDIVVEIFSGYITHWMKKPEPPTHESATPIPCRGTPEPRTGEKT